jgi:hypothetical protein
MAIQHGFLFDHSPEAQNNAPSSGNGAPGIDSLTGTPGPNYQPPVVAPRMSTMGGIGSVTDAPVDVRYSTMQADAQAAVENARRSAGL